MNDRLRAGGGEKPLTRRYRWLLAAVAAPLAAALAFARPLVADPGKINCPVTGGELTIGENTPYDLVNGSKLYFCCNDCVKTFRSDPEKYLLLVDKGKCPVQGNPARGEASLRLVVNNQLYYFCCESCPAQFAAQPASFFKSLPDPVTKKSFTLKTTTPHEVYRGQHYFFATPDSRAKFLQAPEQYVTMYGEKTP
jgi:YHS domain-containing protein